MPEGDTIFRTARALGRALVGKPVTSFRSTFTFLTRFDEDEPLAGQTVDSVESRGKWVLIHFSSGATLATHMLMNGSWHIYRPGERWQRPYGQMRIVLENSEFVTVGFTVPVAKLLRPHELERALRIPSGAVDMLGAEFDPTEIAARMQQKGSEEVGNVLLHQGVFAGVGNVFKSEVCFLTGTNPFSHVADLSHEKIDELIATARKLLKANVLEDSGDGIVTYGGRRRRTTHASDPGESLWVYGRVGKPCRRCGEPVLMQKQGREARITYWCPRCQPMLG